MANLLDTIKQNNPALQQQGVTDETGKLQTLLRAKSGKAVPDSGVASSNLGEQAAVSQTNQQIQNQVAPAAQIQNAGMQAQQAATTQQNQQQVADVAQGRKFDTIQTKLKTTSLLNDLERNKGQIDMNRDRASLEQVGTNLRLQNQEYINNLQREGSLSRLNDGNQFTQALLQTTLGDNQALVEKQLGNRSILDVNENEFRTNMAKMDINTAYDMFKNNMANQKQRALYGGAGALATAGIGAAAGHDFSSPAEEPNTGTTVASGDINTGSAGSIA